MNIHQTLHGYDGGHKLLSASRDLPSSTKRQLLLLSDMSGPSMIKGFETYLTGYPLPEIGAYAFARTWYAGEMKRPGCVWTHTLIIDFANLDGLRDLATLLPLFHRPEPGEAGFHMAVANALDVTEDQTYSNSFPEIDESTAAATLKALYEQPEFAIVVPAETSDIHGSLAISIWSQQWPRLRRNFTFCTGALAPRLFGDRPFDLQIVPLSSSRLFIREANKYRLVQGKRQETDLLYKPWSVRAAYNLKTTFVRSSWSDAEELRGFLWECSEDVNASRSSFLPLAQTYEDILELSKNLASSPDIHFSEDASSSGRAMSAYPGQPYMSSLEIPIKSFINHVSERFPNPKEAATLKNKLFGGKTRSSKRSENLFSEGQILYCLATTDAYSAYDGNALGLRHRSESWAYTHSRDVGSMISLLLHSRISPLGESVFVGILEGLKEESALELATEDPALLPVFISTHPSLAELPQVWMGSVNQQQELMDVLIQDNRTAWEPIVVAILEAGADGIAQDLVNHADGSVILTALNWLNSEDGESNSRKLSQEWQRVLRSEPSMLVDWLCAVPDAQIAVLAFVANLLDPHSTDVHRLTNPVWLRLAENAPRVLNQELLIQIAVFLLSIAFYNTDQASSKLVALAFPIVYDAASKNQIPHSSWRLIAHQVPNFHGVKDWDKCERLLQAVANNARVYQWPVSDLLKAAQDEQLFKRILDYCKEFPEGKQYLMRLRNEVSENASIATELQLRALSQKSLWQRFLSSI